MATCKVCGKTVAKKKYLTKNGCVYCDNAYLYAKYGKSNKGE